MRFPTSRKLTDPEAAEWMRLWMQAHPIGWEVYALTKSVVATQTESDVLTGTLLLESALSHARCLCEFLIGRADNGGNRRWKPNLDVTPLDLLPTWDPVQSLDVDRLHGWLTMIDKEQAHLSRQRVRMALATWKVGQLLDALLVGFSVFLGELDRYDDFSARCLSSWHSAALQLLREAGVTDRTEIVVASSAGIMRMTPAGENSGRAAALIQRTGVANYGGVIIGETP